MAYKIQIPLGRENGSSLNPEEALSIAQNKLEQLRVNGCLKCESLDDIIEDIDVTNANDKLGYIIIHLTEGSLVDASKLAVVGSAMQLFEFDDIADLGDAAKNVKSFSIQKSDVRVDPSDGDITNSKKSFSMASIQERLRLNKLDVHVRLRYIIQDYRRFVKANAKKLTSDDKMRTDLIGCFIADVNQLLHEIPPLVSGENKQIAQLLGVNAVAPSLSKICKDLSLEYPKCQRALKAQGYLPQARYQNLHNLYDQFIQSLAEIVFSDSNTSNPSVESVETAEELEK